MIETFFGQFAHPLLICAACKVLSNHGRGSRIPQEVGRICSMVVKFGGYCFFVVKMDFKEKYGALCRSPR